MRKPLIALAVILGLTLSWYILWHSMVSDRVKQVQASIDHHNQRIKTSTSYITLKAESVKPTGFPFHFRVKLIRPTLSQIFNKETYAVSTAEMVLVPSGNSYHVNLPKPIDAVYATDGQAPENYQVTAEPIPEIYLSAQRDMRCGTPLGGKCTDLETTAPLVSYSATLPKLLMLHASLNGETKDIRFDFPMMVPVGGEIPANLDHPLEIFVGMLREALVYKTK